jgi:serine protease
MRGDMGIIYKMTLGLCILCLSNLSFAKVKSTNKRFIITFKKSQNFEINSRGHVREIVYAKSKDTLKDSFNNIESIDEDILLKIDSSANDTRYDEQWALGYAQGGIEVEEAWNISKGSSSIVVAVIDTGILNHQDISTNLLPGYDFISDSEISRDGNGRDADPTDEGDYLYSNDPCGNGQFKASSWHGTHVSGIVSASTNNNNGVAGVSWYTKILPVRALGKCGGLTSDIADAVKWSAGISVAGVPNNANPAKVINLSLGGVGPCTSIMQDSINQAKSKGAVVVVAAGNSGQNLDFSSYTPANCQGVIVVGSNNQLGQKSYFSNYGSSIDLLAPGGGAGGAVLSLGNLGQTVATSDAYTYLNGTSMSAPFVSGVASLIFSINNGLFPDQIEQILQDSASRFANGSGCNDDCGAGILNARLALDLALDATPDATYSETDPLGAGGGEESSQLGISDDRDGGICGSIDLDNTRGGKGPLSLILFFGLIIIFQFKKRIEYI